MNKHERRRHEAAERAEANRQRILAGGIRADEMDAALRCAERRHQRLTRKVYRKADGKNAETVRRWLRDGVGA